MIMNQWILSSGSRKFKHMYLHQLVNTTTGMEKSAKKIDNPQKRAI